MAVAPSGNAGNTQKTLHNPANLFMDLPVDILLYIIHFLDPIEILAFRKVSKILRYISAERSTWINALRRACIQHDIYSPSFPMQDMTLRELEHAATACRRFSARLRRELPCQIPVLPRTVRLREPPSPAEEFENLRLVPGGRFLFSSSQAFLRLWDLEKRGPNLALIASHEIRDATVVKSVRTRACSSSSEVFVLVTSTVEERFFRMHVCSIMPSAARPEFKLISPDLVLPIVDGFCPNILCATSRHITISAASTTILWDFVEDRWTSWPQEPTNMENTVYLCQNTIVIMNADHGQLRVAPFPTLYPRHGAAVPPEVSSLMLTHWYTLTRANVPSEPLNNCISGITLVFHGRERAPLYFDVLSEFSSRALLTHFMLVPGWDEALIDSGNSDENKHPLVPIALGETLLTAQYRASHSLHLEWIGRCVQSFVVEGRILHVSIANVGNGAGAVASTAAGKETEVISGVLATPGLPLNELNVDFCSFSGRVCARVLREHDEGFRIVVLDYLEPQSERR